MQGRSVLQACARWQSPPLLSATTSIHVTIFFSAAVPSTRVGDKTAVGVFYTRTRQVDSTIAGVGFTPGGCARAAAQEAVAGAAAAPQCPCLRSSLCLQAPSNLRMQPCPPQTLSGIGALCRHLLRCWVGSASREEYQTDPAPHSQAAELL